MNDIKLKNKIELFINDYCGSFEKIEDLEGDASTRKYSRVFSSDKSYIFCIDNNLSNVELNDYTFNIVYNLFNSSSIPVPEIFSIDERNGFLLLQDLGDDLLEYKLKNLNRNEIEKKYKEILDILIKIQMIKGDSIPFKMSFDIEKLMYEFNFFIEHALLGYFECKIGDNVLKSLIEEFNKISRLLYRPEFFVLNHRDFHSRNILDFNKIPHIIDFQDARMGLPHYDLVSLVRDSYVQLDEEIHVELVKYYYEMSRESGVHNFSMDEFNYFFDLMAFQRNIKAVGTFGYQVSKMNNRRYENNIKPSLLYVQDYVSRRSELKDCWEIISGLLDTVDL